MYVHVFKLFLIFDEQNFEFIYQKEALVDRTTLYNIAKLYYIENKSQQEIANIIGVSRPQISRLLKEARELKIVEITLNAPCHYDNSILEKRLSQLLNISKVQIIGDENTNEKDLKQRLELISTFSAEYLTEIIPQFQRIGIGWGQTLYQTIQKMPYTANENKYCFIPLVGGASANNPCYQPNTLVDNISQKCKSGRCFINAPAFVFNPIVRQYIADSSNLGENSTFWDNIDMAFFSIGGSLNKSKQITEALNDKKIIQYLLDNSTVGDFLGNFFDSTGNILLSKEEAITLSIPLDIFYKIPQRICIAFGEEKVPALIITAKNGLFTELITDIFTANQILESLI